MLPRTKATADGADRDGPDRPPIVLTLADRERILALLQREPMEPRVRDFLREELHRADVVSSAIAPRALVMMGSEVTFVDHSTERVRRVRLVYPDEADGHRSVSVLSTVGSALLGLGPGQSILCADHEGERRLTVLEIEGRAEDCRQRDGLCKRYMNSEEVMDTRRTVGEAILSAASERSNDGKMVTIEQIPKLEGRHVRFATSQ